MIELFCCKGGYMEKNTDKIFNETSIQSKQHKDQPFVDPWLQKLEAKRRKLGLPPCEHEDCSGGFVIFRRG